MAHLRCVFHYATRNEKKRKEKINEKQKKTIQTKKVRKKKYAKKNGREIFKPKFCPSSTEDGHKQND